MYEEAFGFDWQTLSADDALRRMYALGVAAVLGDKHPDEYRRIMKQASTAYQRSVLELSFKEGKQRAERNRDEFPQRDAVWEALVEDVPERAPPSSRDDVDSRRPKGSVPTAVTRTSMLEYSGDDLSRLELPDLLVREG